MFLSNIFNVFLNFYLSAKYANNYSFPGGYRRIYHYHIQKTGGTSLNTALLGTTGEDYRKLYSKLAKSLDKRVVVKDKVFVGWNKWLIERGNYYYAFSHIPQHKLNIPRETFTITIIRNPVKRLLSHYQMIKYYKDNDINHPMMKTQAAWLGNSFSGYLEKVPKKHLLRQLYMFSDTFNVNEALEEILSCSHCFLTENYSKGLEDLNQKLGLNIRLRHGRKSKTKYEPTKKELDIMSEMLRPELDLYNKITEMIV